MNFYEGKNPFRGQSPLAYDRKNDSTNLLRKVRDFNKAQKGCGLKVLRSFLSKVVETPGYASVKPIYHLVNQGDFGGAVAHARVMLSQQYDSPAEHRVETQIAALVKKYPFPGSESVRKANALKKFLRGERRNRHMNALLRARRVRTDELHDGTSYGGIDPNPFVGHMRAFIARTIGNEVNWKEIMGECRWGPGSSVGVHGKFTHFARKLLSEKWTCTPAALPYAITACSRFPVFWELLGLTRVYSRFSGVGPPERGDIYEVVCSDLELFKARFLARVVIVQANKIAFVSKDADCDRTIASEPLLNQFVQLAIDQFMKKSLLRWGIDLEDQGPNQWMAYLGTLDGSNPFTTADLKNASGSIYTEIIRELFSADWFVALNCLRSPSWTVDDDTPVKYHGFASMGNGFCFPVETLIFASICYAAHRYTKTPLEFRVYGDDIIMRQNESGIVQEYLRYFGFELNPDKSFFFGPFRESCGADWHSGKPVRPVFLDDALDTFEQRIRAHNAFIRNGSPELARCFEHSWPAWVTAFCRPFSCETDEALDNSAGTIANPINMRCKTLGTPAWYGVTLSANADEEIEQHRDFPVAYRSAALMGASSDVPFAMRRETRLGVARFGHGGGKTVMFPHETGAICPKLPDGPPLHLGVTGWGLKTAML